MIDYFTKHPEKIFPTISILLSFGSMCIYLWKGNIRQSIYWFAACLLTGSMTF